MTNCKDCKNHKVGSILTADSFEHWSGVYCSKCEEVLPDEEFGVCRGIGRLVAYDDFDVYKHSKIPDWCPLLDKSQSFSCEESILHKFDKEEELSDLEVRLLVKGISKIRNAWVSGFYISETSGEYNSMGKWVEKRNAVILVSFSSGGFSKTEVYPESICRCTGKKDDTGEYLYEHDFIDPNHYNEVEYSGECITINGDRRLSVVLNDKPFHIYGNRYDRIIHENQEKES